MLPMGAMSIFRVVFVMCSTLWVRLKIHAINQWNQREESVKTKTHMPGAPQKKRDIYNI